MIPIFMYLLLELISVNRCFIMLASDTYWSHTIDLGGLPLGPVRHQGIGSCLIPGVAHSAAQAKVIELVPFMSLNPQVH